MRRLPMHLVTRIVREALLEDLGPGDLTTGALVPAGARARGTVTAGRRLVLAGLEPACEAFRILDPGAVFPTLAVPGGQIPAGGTILEVEGAARAILSAERTALNFLGRLSGIATMARRCVELVAGTRVEIYDTRKTTPGLRLLERDAVALGGARNHRFGLFDAVLIKDNHLALAGGTGEALRAARATHGARHTIEVEVESLEGLAEALEAGADIVLLDNMPPDMVRRAVEMVSRLAARQGGRRVLLEASGGIDETNLRAFAETGVDRISLGALTHSPPAADVGLSVRPPAP